MKAPVTLAASLGLTLVALLASARGEAAEIKVLSTVGMQPATPQLFQISAVDPDGERLDFAWFVDGVRQQATGPVMLSPASLAPGNHTVLVTVTDPLGLSNSTSWTFTVPPPQPNTFGGFGFGLEWLLLLLAIIIAATVAFVIGRPSKGKKPQS